MEATVLKEDFLAYRRRFLVTKPSKKIVEEAQVTISVSEKMSVSCPGFQQDLNCKSIRWGTVALPYKLWRHIIENLLPVMSRDEISISAETCELEFCGAKIINPKIRVTRLDRSVFEIPADAKPIQIVAFALDYDIVELRNSVAWTIVKPALETVRNQIKRACSPLKKFKVTYRDIAMLVAHRQGIEDKRGFAEILFP